MEARAPSHDVVGLAVPEHVLLGQAGADLGHLDQQVGQRDKLAHLQALLAVLIHGALPALHVVQEQLAQGLALLQDGDPHRRVVDGGPLFHHPGDRGAAPRQLRLPTSLAAQCAVRDALRGREGLVRAEGTR